MAINRHSSTITIPQTVEDVAGTFTLDCSTGTNFLVNMIGGVFENEINTPVYVGGKTAAITPSTGTNTNIPLNDLTGGLASAPSDGDVIVVAYAVGNNNATQTINTNGYISLANPNQSDTQNSSVVVSYKIISGDTQVQVGATGTTDIAGVVAIQVWRNIDQTTPIDVTRTTATAGNSSLANPPAITTATENAVIIAIGAAGITHTTAFTQGGDLSNFITSVGTNVANDIVIGMGSKSTTTMGTTFDPAAFSTTTGTNFSWVAVTLALRPNIKTAAIPATINFTNVPSLRNDINVDVLFTKTYSYTPNTYVGTISWSSAIKQIAPLATNIRFASPLSYSFYSQNSTIFSSKDNLSGEDLVEKTEIITATQTWTAPSDVSRIEVLLCGGGGSGDSTSVTTPNGGLGSAIKSVLSVIPGTTYTITIGAGGAQVGAGLDGSSGSPSSFGALLSVDGATGGENNLKRPGGTAKIQEQQAIFVGYDEVYGLAGLRSTDLRIPGAPNTGQGGNPGRAGGSGVCIIKYRSAS